MHLGMFLMPLIMESARISHQHLLLRVHSVLKPEGTNKEGEGLMHRTQYILRIGFGLYV